MCTETAPTLPDAFTVRLPATSVGRCEALFYFDGLIHSLFHDLPVQVDLLESATKRSEWSYRYDDQGRLWMTGASHFSRGVSEIYLRTPERLTEDDNFVLLLDLLRKQGFHFAKPGKAGLTIQIDSPPHDRQTYQIMDLSRFSDPRFIQEALTAQLNMPRDFRRFVLRGYASRMEIDPATLEKLEAISQQVQNRSILFAKTQQHYFELRERQSEVIFLQDGNRLPNDPMDAARLLGRTMPDHFDFEGGALMVWSRHAGEPLPLEILTGFKVPRDGEGLTVEVGRYFVDKISADDTSFRLIALMSAVAKGLGNVDRVVIEADITRARLFRQFGFKPLHERVNFAGKKEFIMAARPEDVIELTLAAVVQRINAAREKADKSRLPRLMARQRSMPFSLSASGQWDPKNLSSPVVVLGGEEPVRALLSWVRDASLSGAPPKKISAAIQMRIEDSDELYDLSEEDIATVVPILMEASKSVGDLEPVFEMWLRERKGEKIAQKVFPPNTLRLFCEQRLEPLRQLKLPVKQLEARLFYEMEQKADFIFAFGEPGMRALAAKMAALENKAKSAFDLALEQRFEMTFSVTSDERDRK